MSQSISIDYKYMFYDDRIQNKFLFSLEVTILGSSQQNKWFKKYVYLYVRVQVYIQLNELAPSIMYF